MIQTERRVAHGPCLSGVKYNEEILSGNRHLENNVPERGRQTVPLAYRGHNPLLPGKV